MPSTVSTTRPALDANPLRFAALLPFAALLGSRSSASRPWASHGLAASCSGAAVLLAAAAARHLLRVEPRSRLPLAFLLAVPAGRGLRRHFDDPRLCPTPQARRRPRLVVRRAVGEISRDREGRRRCRSSPDVQRQGREPRQPRRRRPSAQTGARSCKTRVAWFNRGVVEAARGNRAEAERAYRAALPADPVQPNAAGEPRRPSRSGRPGRRGRGAAREGARGLAAAHRRMDEPGRRLRAHRAIGRGAKTPFGGPPGSGSRSDPESSRSVEEPRSP